MLGLKYKPANNRLLPLILAVAVFLSVASFFVAGRASATSSLVPCASGYAKQDGNGSCVPIDQANLDIHHCANDLTTAVPPATVQQGVGAVDSYCSDKGGIASLSAGNTAVSFGPKPKYKDQCGGGKGNEAVNISIDFGCRGKGNPIVDMAFAGIRFLSIGVGIIIVGSLVVAGIQYTTSRGDPAGVAKAINRIRSTGFAFLLYIFIYALLNWLIPAGVFN